MPCSTKVNHPFRANPVKPSEPSLLVRLTRFARPVFVSVFATVFVRPAFAGFLLAGFVFCTGGCSGSPPSDPHEDAGDGSQNVQACEPPQQLQASAGSAVAALWPRFRPEQEVPQGSALDAWLKTAGVAGQAVGPNGDPALSLENLKAIVGALSRTPGFMAKVIQRWLHLGPPNDAQDLELSDALWSDMATELNRLAALEPDTRLDKAVSLWVTNQERALSPELARYYGLQARSEEWATYRLPDNRPGILGTGAFLTRAHRRGQRGASATVLFGLCDSFSHPPGPRPTESMSRAAFDAAMDGGGNAQCRSCHEISVTLFPAFERFSPSGRSRSVDADGGPLDTAFQADFTNLLKNDSTVSGRGLQDLARNITARDEALTQAGACLALALQAEMLGRPAPQRPNPSSCSLRNKPERARTLTIEDALAEGAYLYLCNQGRGGDSCELSGSSPGL